MLQRVSSNEGHDVRVVGLSANGELIGFTLTYSLQMILRYSREMIIWYLNGTLMTHRAGQAQDSRGLGCALDVLTR